MPAHRVPRVQLICAYEPCSNPFEAMPAEAKRGGVRYCSPPCRTLARRQPRSEKIILTCAYDPCGKPFEVLPHQATLWQYCGQDCYHAARTTRTHDAFTARFWRKVDKTPGQGPNGVCWLWTGATHANGYGNFRATPYREGNVSAHVVSWFLHTGAWPPDGISTLHTCDMPLCVQPKHLFLGTHTDNMQDMVSKGRQAMLTNPVPIIEGIKRYNREHPTRPQTSGDRNGMRLHPESVLRGEKSPRSKLTDAQWTELLALWDTGEWSQRALGKRFGVTGVRISQKIRAHKNSQCKHSNTVV